MMSTNGQYKAPDSKRRTERPDSDLDVYADTTRPQADVKELQRVNYGLGNYDDGEHWQQVRSYHKGLWARAAVGSVIRDKAEREFKREVGETKLNQYREDREIDLDSKIEDVVGVDPEPTPTTWRMAEMRTESSRGRDARLMDNVFGRVVERITKGGEEVKQALQDLGAKR